MTHASLFSGIGGTEVAATMLGWENIFHCEINEFVRKILDYWYPNSKSYEDITKTDFSEWRGKVDVLSGGFPCQPFSYAGKRRGADDDRYLWPFMFKAIDQIRPTWVVAENVAGITSMVEQGEVSEMGGQASLFEEVDGLHRYRIEETFTLQRICDDLESHGYSVQPVLVPACSVGAPHRRDRVFIVARRIAADTDSVGRSERRFETDGREHDSIRAQVFGIAEGQGSSGTTPDTSCECSQRMRPEQSETCGTSQEQSGGICGEDGSRGTSADTSREGLERQDESGCGQGGQRTVADTSGIGAGQQCECGRGQHREPRTFESRNGHWPCPSCEWDYCGERWQNFPTVSPIHRGNDGIPFDVDSLSISFSKWRTESLKAYGNAIVPQVMFEIFRAIELTEKTN